METKAQFFILKQLAREINDEGFDTIKDLVINRNHISVTVPETAALPDGWTPVATQKMFRVPGWKRIVFTK